MENLYEHRRYMIFDSADLSVINFSEVCELSADTARKSVDGTRAILKWNGETVPSSIVNLNNVVGPLTHEEAFALMQTAEWMMFDAELPVIDENNIG